MTSVSPWASRSLDYVPGLDRWDPWFDTSSPWQVCRPELVEGCRAVTVFACFICLLAEDNEYERDYWNMQINVLFLSFRPVRGLRLAFVGEHLFSEGLPTSGSDKLGKNVIGHYSAGINNFSHNRCLLVSNFADCNSKTLFLFFIWIYEYSWQSLTNCVSLKGMLSGYTIYTDGMYIALHYVGYGLNKWLEEYL